MRRSTIVAKFKHLATVAAVLAALLVPFGISTPAQAAASISAINNQPQDTGGGGGTNDLNCGSGLILQRVISNWDSGYPAITQTQGVCYSLNSDGLSSASAGTNTAAGGSNTGTNSGYWADCTYNRDRTWVIVGARVYLEGSGSFASGVQLYCAKLAGGSSSTRVLDGGYLGRTTSGSYQDIYCNAGTVAVGLHLRTGAIADAFGLNCATISGATQTISFSALSSRSLTGGNLTLSATTTSTSSLSYSSTNTSICSVSGSTVSMVSVGTCTINANAASDTNYAAATQVAQSFSITQGTQAAITLTSTAAVVAVPLTLTASGGSGTGTFSYSVNSAGTTGCSITGTTLTATATGTCSVTATKSADTNYLAGSSAATNITVTAGNALNPIFGTPTFASGTYTIPVTNYDANYTWTPSASNGGTVVAGTPSGSTISYTVTPVAGTTSALTVTTTRASYNGGTATATAYYPGCNPTTVVGSVYTSLSFVATTTCQYLAPVATYYDYLVVAGGGAGGVRAGGGGGAGGYLTSVGSASNGSIGNRLSLTAGQVITVTVGAGGVPNFTNAGTSGGNSSLVAGTTLTAIGGGYGGGGNQGCTSSVTNAGNGGSGGGTTGQGCGYTVTAGTGTTGQGNAGAVGSAGANYQWTGGGGGGAGSAGTVGNINGVAGTGGSGAANSITGTAVCYAAGGGGGAYGGKTLGPAGGCTGLTSTAGAGSIGIAAAGSALNNTGSGGGGSGFDDSISPYNGVAGSGGSGIVVLRYATTAPTPTLTVSGQTTSGLTVNVTNYDPNFVYTPTLTSGAGTLGTSTVSNGTLSIPYTGVTAGASLTVNVAVTLNGVTQASASITGTALQQSQTITFSSTAPTSAVVGGTTYTVVATSTSSLTVSFTIDPASTAVCSLAGSVISFQTAGTCRVNANQAGNAQYLPATQVYQSFTVGKGTQSTLTVTSTTGNYGSTVTLTSTGGSGTGAVTYAIITGGTATGCSINGTTLSYTSAGTCKVAATQAADANYNSFTSATVDVVIAKIAQTITFGQIANRTITSGTFTVSPTTDAAGQTVVVTSADTTKCTVSGFTVTLVAVGTCTLNANVATSTNYLAATQVQQAFTISSVTITFNANTGTGTMANLVISSPSGASLTSNAYTKAGFAFGTWNTVANGSGTSYTNAQTVSIAADTTLYAQWLGTTFTVTFDGNYSGSSSSTATYVTNGTVALPTAPTRSGYTFSGWSTAATNGTNVGSSGSVSPLTSSGLILNYTVGDSTSYPGTGNSITDLAAQLNSSVTGQLNGTLYSAPTYTAGSPSYLNLTSANTQYIYSGNLTTRVIDTKYSFFTWVYPTANDGSIVDERGQSNADGWQDTQMQLVGGKPWFGVWTNNMTSVSSNTALALNQWYYMGLTYDGTTLRGYVNGVQVASIAATRVAPAALYFALGKSDLTGASGSGNFRLGAFHVYNVGVTADNVMRNYLASCAAYVSCSSLTLYAQWTANSQSITYAANGGTGTVANSVANTDASVTLASAGFTRSGYTLSGWNTAANGTGTPYALGAAINMPVGGIALYAQWTANSQSVTYSANGGSGSVATQTANTDASITLAGSGFTRTGYTLSGWNTAANGTGTPYSLSAAITMPAGGLALYAQWAAASQTITYAANGGTGTVADTVANTAASITLAGSGFTRSGYTLASWNTAANGSGTSYALSAVTTMPAGGLTLYAQWTGTSQTITYAANGGTGSVANSVANTAASVTLASTGFTRSGYTLAGWNTAADGSGATYSLSASIVMPVGGLALYAQWSANTNSVTYNTQGGSAVATGSFTTGGSVTLPAAPTKANYTFTGWFLSATGGTALGATYSPPDTTGITIYAQWVATAATPSITSQPQAIAKTVGQTASFTVSATTADAGTLSYQWYKGATPIANATNATYSFVTSSTSDAGNYSVVVTNTYTGAISTVTSSTVALTMSSALVLAAPTAGLTGTFGGALSIDLTAGASGGTGTYSYALASGSLPSGATLSAGVISASNLTAAGSYPIAIRITDGNGATVTSSSFTITVQQATQTITFAQPANRTVTSGTFNVSGTTNASQTVTFTIASASAGICSIANGTVTLLGVGACTIQADAASTSNFLAASQLSRTVTISAVTVSFDANGGTGTTTAKSITSPTGNALTANSFSRTGYTFAGWSTTSGTASVAYTNSQTVTLSVDTTLYAQWTANTYNVNYDSQQGSAVTAGTFITAGTVTFPVTNPTRTGYVFAGWFAATSGGVALTSPYAPGVTADITLYAHWTPVNYTVYYYSINSTSGSAPTDSTNYNIGVSVTVLSNSGNLARTGYTLGGWTTAADGSGTVYSAGNTFVVGSSNINLYPKWVAVNYTVTYLAPTADGGSVPTDSSNYNITQTIPVRGNTGSLTRAGYSFAGWTIASNGTGTVLTSSDTYTVGAANVSFYAKWTAIPYSVTYVASTATGGSVPSDSSVYNIGGSATVLGNTGNLVRTGYTFAGWTTAADGTGTVLSAGGTVSIAASDVSLYAAWTPINYSVTYNANNASTGSVPTDATNYNIGQNITVRGNTGSLARTGYSFAGWNLAADGTGSNYQSGNQILVGSANVVLYAKWTANTYTVTYNANAAGGVLARASEQYTTAGTAVTLPGQGTLAKTGYIFGGWATTPNGTALSGTFTTAVNVTLYAVWNIKTINVNYSKGTAAAAIFTSFPNNSSVSYSTSITIGSGVDTRISVAGTSYDLLGWSDGNSIYQSGSSYIVGDSDVTFTALWVPVFAVRYVFNGGSAALGESSLDSQCLGLDSTCVDGQSITTNLAPSKTGYTFAGWVDQSGQTIAAGASVTVSATSYLFYASWTAINYAITYQSDGGSAAPTQASRTIGQTFTVGPAVSKTGYSFGGWSDGNQILGPGALVTVGSSNITFTAQWIPDVYTVAYDWNGGHGSSTPSDSFTVGTGAVTLPVAGDHLKDGYTFNGWSTRANGNLLGLTYTPTESLTLYAIWGRGSYTLTMNANGGTVSDSSYSVENGNSQTLPTPARTHFHFDGWFDASSNGNLLGMGGDVFTPASSRTLYAHWTQDSLVGMGANSKLGNLTASSTVRTRVSVFGPNNTVTVDVPAGALPTGTVLDIYLLQDTSRAASLISGTNNFVVNLVVSWLASDNTVPSTASGLPVKVTIEDPNIKAGAAVYSLIGNTATYLATATVDGQVTAFITDDPELVVAAVVPGAPTSPTAVAGNGSALVSWNAPSTDGGSPITSYVVTSNAGQTCTATSSLSCTVSGLTNGTSYTFTVQAVNAVGASTASSATPSVTPLAPQSITFGSLANRTMGTGTVSLSASATSGLAVSFSSANTAICTVTGATVTLVAAGVCAIQANQAGGSGYSPAAQVSQSFTISSALHLATPTAGLLAATYNASYSLTLISSGGAGGISFAVVSGVLPAGLSLDSSTGTISGIPTAVANSTISVRVTDANSATATVSFTIAVAAADQSALTLTTISGTFGTALPLFASGGSSTGSVSFSVTDGTVACSLNGTSLTAAGAGTCLVTATRAADANYSAVSSAPTTVTFAQATQAPLTMTDGNGVALTPITLTASGGSGTGAVNFAVTNGTATCSLVGALLTPSTAGTCSVVATKSSDANYTQVSSAAVTFTFVLATQLAITLTSVNGTATVPLALTFTGGNGTGAVSYSVLDGTTTCALVNGSLTASAAGTCSVTVNKAADATYAQAVSQQATVTFAAAPIATPIGGPLPPVVEPTVNLPTKPETWIAPNVEPVVASGQNVFVVDNVVSPVTTTVTEDLQGIKVVTPDWQFSLKVQATTNGTQPDAVSGSQLVVSAGATVAVTGEHFQSGTLVKVWLRSEPVLLGTVSVNSDGSFASSLPLPSGLELGNHTLMLQGLNNKNELQNAQASLLVKDTSTAESKTVVLKLYFPVGSSRVSFVTHRGLVAMMHAIAGLKNVTIATTTFYAHSVSRPLALKIGRARSAVIEAQMTKIGLNTRVNVTAHQSTPGRINGQLLEVRVQGN